MSTVVALFTDEESARSGAADVVREGVSPNAVHLHQRGQIPSNAGGVVADEFVTGGFFNNFANLLEGLLGSKRAPGTAASYAEVVRHEGVAVSVDGDSVDAAQVEHILRAAGAHNVSRSTD